MLRAAGTPLSKKYYTPSQLLACTLLDFIRSLLSLPRPSLQPSSQEYCCSMRAMCFFRPTVYGFGKETTALRLILRRPAAKEDKVGQLRSPPFTPSPCNALTKNKIGRLIEKLEQTKTDVPTKVESPDRRRHAASARKIPVSYTHLTLPTIYSV